MDRSVDSKRFLLSHFFLSFYFFLDEKVNKKSRQIRSIHEYIEIREVL